MFLNVRRLIPKGRRPSSSFVLAFANLSELMLPLARGMILARLLEPAQFGLAISVTLFAGSMELVSDLGIGQQALRAGTINALSTLHSVSIIRGALLTLAIAAAGPVFALMFNVPGAAWIYSLIGLASFIRSFSHLEPRIRMREYNYTPEALTTLGTQLTWTVVTVIIALVLRDYRAIAIGVLLASFSTVLITHLCSTSRYRLGWDKAIVNESIRFGRPLTVNGVALVIGSLGDRFLIGARIGLVQLAQYTALSTAAFMPRSIVTKFAASLFVPHFINTVDVQGSRRLANAWVVLITGVGSIFGFCYMALGQFVIATAFGSRYLPDQTSVSLIAGLACIRYMATIPVAPSLATGRTSFVLLNTSLAASGLVLGAFSLYFKNDLHVLIAAMIIGEGAALLWVLHKLSREISVSSLVLWTATLFPLFMLLFAGAVLTLVPETARGLRWTLCGFGIAAELACASSLLRWSGSTADAVLQMIFPKHRSPLQTVPDPH